MFCYGELTTSQKSLNKKINKMKKKIIKVGEDKYVALAGFGARPCTKKETKKETMKINKMEELVKDFEIMKDFYSKFNENFGKVELEMEDNVFVIRIYPKETKQ